MRSNLTTKLENKAGGRFSNLKNLPTPSNIAVTLWPTVHGRRW